MASGAFEACARNNAHETHTHMASKLHTVCIHFWQTRVFISTGGSTMVASCGHTDVANGVQSVSR